MNIKKLLVDILPPFILRKIKPYFPGSDPRKKIRFANKSTLRLPDGKKFQFRKNEKGDLLVIKQIFFERDYEINKLSRTKEIENYYHSIKNPIIIDAGANIGAASVWFSLSFPKSKIFSIEPVKGNYDLLIKNCSDFQNIFPFHAAIASESGSLFISDPGRGTCAYRTSKEPQGNKESINAYTIEDLMNKDKNMNPFILKIDIEGAEEDLFSKNTDILKKFPLIIIELHDWMFPSKSTSKNFLFWHATNKRDLEHFGENIFSISNPLNI